MSLKRILQLNRQSSSAKESISKFLKQYLQDSLYKNSMYLMLSTAVSAGFGFFFWILNARLYSTEQIGIATTILSISTLLLSFSLLGLNHSMVRYFPKAKNKNHLINTIILTAGLAAFILAVGYMSLINIFTPKLVFIKNNFFYFWMFVIAVPISVMNTLNDSTYVALREAKYVFFKNSGISILKIVFSVIFISLGAYGLFLSFSASTLIIFFLSLVILYKQFSYKFIFKISGSILKELSSFSFANYFAGIVGTLPTLILPIIITNKISASASAYFYIDMMIINLLSIIPSATTQALFAESSHDNSSMNVDLRKAIKQITIFLIPAVFITILGGKYILLFFGKKFSSEGFSFLQIMAFAQLITAINYIAWTILRIRKNNKIIIISSAVNTFLTIMIGYYLLPYGLFGIGIAWIIGEIAMTLLYLLNI